MILNARLLTRASPCDTPSSRSVVAASVSPTRASSPAMNNPHHASTQIGPRNDARASSVMAAAHAFEPDVDATRVIDRATRAAARIPRLESKDVSLDAIPAVKRACVSSRVPCHPSTTGSRTDTHASQFSPAVIPHSAASKTAERHAGHALISAGRAFRDAPPSAGTARHASNVSFLASLPPHHVPIMVVTSSGDIALIHALNAYNASRVVASPLVLDESAASIANGHACGPYANGARFPCEPRAVASRSKVDRNVSARFGKQIRVSRIARYARA